MSGFMSLMFCNFIDCVYNIGGADLDILTNVVDKPKLIDGHC